jgi:branched-chain amino acid transport system substrate-binding protein
MNIPKGDLFLIKLKSSLINKRSVTYTLVFFVLMFIVCGCASSPRPRPLEGRGTQPSTVTLPGVREVKKSPSAPWEVWPRVRYPNKSLHQAYRYSEEGNLPKASEAFLSAVPVANNAEEAEAALLEACSSLLKEGKSDEVLSKISKYASLNNKKPADLDSRFSLLTAYAYIHKADRHQALAWFSQTWRASRGTGSVAEEARRGAMQYVRTFDGGTLSSMSTKWKRDTFVSSLIQGEQSRRLQGGSPLAVTSINKWFDTETYSIEDSLPYAGHVPPSDRADSYQRDESLYSPHGAGIATIPDTRKDTPDQHDAAPGSKDLVVSDLIGPMNFGAYLPISGTYKEHAKRIQEGILLALATYLPGSELVSVDSEEDGAQAIHSLVNAKEVRAMFGPLVVKDISIVAGICEQHRLPCISFSKRKGIPDLGSAMFRLGANPDNQLSVLLRYARRKLGGQSIVLFYPENSSGKEFADAYHEIRDREGLDFLHSVSYNPRSLESVHTAVEDAKQYMPDTVIIADTLTSAEPLLRHLRDPGLAGGISRVPLMGTSLFSNSQELRRYSSLVEGVYVVSLFNPISDRDEVQNFFRMYRKKFNREPDLLSALSYDAALFVAHAYASERFKNNLKGNEIRALFEADDVYGVTGRIRVLENGEMYRDLPVVVVSNGVLVEE